jgi:hypothetical protein
VAGLTERDLPAFIDEFTSSIAQQADEKGIRQDAMTNVGVVLKKGCSPRAGSFEKTHASRTRKQAQRAKSISRHYRAQF